MSRLRRATAGEAAGKAHRREGRAFRERPYRYDMPMVRTATLVQLSDELLERLDAYRAREGRSRSEVVCEAIERYLQTDREAEIDRLLVEAYTRQAPESSGASRPPGR